MGRKVMGTLGVCAVVGVAIVVGTAQDRTIQPGQPTQGKVWIQNREATEAIPVIIETVGSNAAPMRVQMIGAPAVTVSPGSVVQTRRARQSWEYRTVTVSSGDDAATVLNAAGADGWELAGVAPVASSGTLFVMKRAR